MIAVFVILVALYQADIAWQGKDYDNVLLEFLHGQHPIYRYPVSTIWILCGFESTLIQGADIAGPDRHSQALLASHVLLELVLVTLALHEEALMGTYS